MDAKEMHIEVREAINKVASSTRLTLFDEQIDFYLNKAQNRFISSKIPPEKEKPQYEENQVLADTLSTLVTDASLECHRNPMDKRRYFSILPGDYRHLITDETVLMDPCDVPLIESVIKRYYSPLILPNDDYTKLIVKVGNTEVFNQATDAPGTVTLDRFAIIDFVMWKMRTMGYKVYWENFISTPDFASAHRPHTMVLWSDTPQTLSILYSGKSRTAPAKEYNLLKVSNYTAGISPINRVPNERVKSHYISKMLATPFYKPSDKRLLSYSGAGLLNVIAGENLTVISTEISYIRKPHPISVTLDLGSELPAHWHQAVCDLAIEELQLVVKDPGFGARSKFNQEKPA